MDRFHLNLVYVYHTIVASGPLLELAHSATKEVPLEEYFYKHLNEEKDHAAWLREDLMSVGIDPAALPPPQLVKEMVGTVYYTIFHGDVAYLLGYMRMLESWRMSKEAIQYLKDTYPASLLRTFLLHREKDPEHLKEIEKVVETLPPERKLVVDQAESESYIYTCMMIEEWNRPPPVKAN